MSDTVIDVASLEGGAGFIIREALHEDGTGSSVVGAGDVNGDGIEDILIGAPGFTNGEYLAGTVYVIFGKAGAARNSIDLANLSPAEGFAIDGTQVRGNAGNGLGAAGDINGDGYDDIIIGEIGNNKAGANAGGAYIVFGGPDIASGTIDLANLGDRGFFVQGAAERDYAGAVVTAAGDVNGDGIGDLLISARGNDASAENAGAGYVIYGRQGGNRPDIDLSQLGAADGFVILGETPSDAAGASIAAAGDVNGDGFDDIIIGAPLREGTDAPAAGRAYVIFGKAGSARGTIELSALTGTDGFAVYGSSAEVQLGTAVSAAGDINDDGVDDFLVGAPFGEWGGGVYVVYGKAGATRQTIELDGLNGGDGFLIRGDKTFDMLGFSAARAGDINGDGIDDIVVSAPYNDEGGNLAGKAYVIFGKSAATRGTVEVGELSAGDGFELKITEALARLGRSLGAGDFNDDGINDIIVGAPYGETGAAYVIFGSNAFVSNGPPAAGDDVLRALTGTPITFFASQLLANDSDPQGDASLSIAAVKNAVGGSVFLTEDGAVRFVPNPEFTGLASFDYVVSDGSLEDTGHVEVRVAPYVPARTISLAAIGDEGFVVEGKRVADNLGVSASKAGDVNGDGVDDFIIGSQARNEDNYITGAAYVIFGKSGDTFEDIELLDLTPADGFAIGGNWVGHVGLGFSVSSAGDIDGDGIDDLIVGTSSGETAYVVFGKAGAGRGDIDVSALLPADGFTISSGSVLTTKLGEAVSGAGDVNGDGFADMIVGAKQSEAGGRSSGEAYVIYGGARNILGDLNLSTLSPAQGFAIRGAANDRAGNAVSSAGDINGDGFADIIVGAYGADAVRGKAYVLFGKAGATRTAIDLETLAPTDGFVVTGAPGDALGSSVSGAGDLNSDGYADIVVGASGGLLGGRAYVIYGQPGETRANVNVPGSSGDGPGTGVSDFIGQSVSSAGDFDGDGFDDFIIGAPGVDEGRPNAGAAYLIYGNAQGGPLTVNVKQLTAGQGFMLRGGEESNFAGTSVAGIGDINGDGFDDIIIGEPSGTSIGSSAGEVYIIFGRARLAPLVESPLDDKSVTQGEEFTFQIPGDTFFDPDLDPLLLSAVLSGGSPLPSWLLFEPRNGTFSGSAPADINDIIEVTVRASDGSAEASDSFKLFVTSAPEWTLIANDGFSGELGGSGRIFGTSGVQDIEILDVAGTVVFDPSFNRGGDVIRLQGDADEWRIVSVGSSAVLSDGDTLIEIPAGKAGMVIVFDDGARLLRYDTAAETLKIGSQSFANDVVQIIAVADGSLPLAQSDPLADAYLVLNIDGHVVAGGNLAVFGTAGHEQVSLTYGNINLDASFNRGGDTLALDAAASSYLASVIGSSVFLNGSALDIMIPTGMAGIDVLFSGSDERLLRYDAALDNVYIGPQLIGDIPAALTTFG